MPYLAPIEAKTVGWDGGPRHGRRVVATPHSLTGALAASRSRSLPAAFTLGLASHLELDTLPYHNYDRRGLTGKLTALTDLTLAGLLLTDADLSPAQWAGALGGIAPDLLAQVTCRRDPFTRHVHLRLHSQRETCLAVAVVLQAATSVWCYTALARRHFSQS